MGTRKPRLTQSVRNFYRTYTQGLTREDLQRLFTRDAPDAYRFFARGIDREALAALSWHRRWITHARLLFLAFTLKLSPARRLIFGAALVAALLGLIQLARSPGVSLGAAGVRIGLPLPVFAHGTGWLLLGFLLLNLLVLLEVADRLSLKNDLDIAREIQQAMLPRGTITQADVEAFGLTRPANTVGGDFYDILRLADGRLVVSIGDVAGKGSPAALLMALLLAMFRTLADEGLEPAALARRLNVQVGRHAPPSRFITLFFAYYDPATGHFSYVNAGQTPPLLLRRHGTIERLEGGGLALGMFEHSDYTAHWSHLDPGEVLVLYSDGITEAEDPAGRPFEETGLERVARSHARRPPQELAASIFEAVSAHVETGRLADDLTVLVLGRRSCEAG